ncbi:MAG: hypothetical protein LBV58_02080 [Acholeplasmatales bacterium]|jgi:predicted AAA+ superfamily ATPase|nr:hypothetical protein [Acholeplasmatales bacterium]
MSFPVGKVDYLDIYPLNFEEFLLNTNEKLLKTIKEAYVSFTPLSNELHELSLNYLFSYLAIGGLPEVVNTFIEKGSYVECQNMLKNI